MPRRRRTRGPSGSIETSGSPNASASTAPCRRSRSIARSRAWRSGSVNVWLREGRRKYNFSRMSDTADDADFPTRFPIFPLPNVVLFPGTYLPLHIFEPRYRAMTEAALSGDEVIGMVLIRPDEDPM